MNQLEILFAHGIHSYSLDEHQRCHGPVFHKWLPDGRNDALQINYPQENATAFLWFERRGYVADEGLIIYDVDRNDIDGALISDQDVLEGGYLFGSVILTDISTEEFEAVVNDNIGSEEYEQLGKRLVKKIIDPLLVQFTSILKYTYGQYWIEVATRFDSRNCSLGEHCKRLGLFWVASNLQRIPFCPTERSSAPLKAVLWEPPFDTEYIDKDAWEGIGDQLRSNYKPPLSASIASRVNRLVVELRIEHALIEVVTCLEIAIEEYVKNNLDSDTTLKQKINGFWDLTLPTRLTLVAALAPVDTTLIKDSLKAIEARNNFVHDGKIPSDDADFLIHQVLLIINKLNYSERLKFPSSQEVRRFFASRRMWHQELNNQE